MSLSQIKTGNSLISGNINNNMAKLQIWLKWVSQKVQLVYRVLTTPSSRSYHYSRIVGGQPPWAGNRTITTEVYFHIELCTSSYFTWDCGLSGRSLANNKRYLLVVVGGGGRRLVVINNNGLRGTNCEQGKRDLRITQNLRSRGISRIIENTLSERHCIT